MDQKAKIKTRWMNVTVVAKFIEAYKNEPCLWKTKSKEYNNRNKKKIAYDKMVLLLKNEGIQDANKDFVVKKINVLRCCWRKEYNKVLKTNFKYKPSLWYYNLLHFVVDENEISTKINESYKRKWVKKKSEDNINIEENEIELILERDEETELKNSSNDNTINDLVEIPKNDLSFVNERSDKICILQQNNNSKIIDKNNSDEYDAFGFIVASKLRKIASKNELQQLLCENIINNALLGATLGKLTEESNILF